MSIYLKKEDVAKKINKTLDEFLEWSQSFRTDWIINDDLKDGPPVCVYTDGDQGVIVLQCYSEIFEENGLTMRFVKDLSYCDIDIESFFIILEEMTDANQKWFSYDETLEQDEEVVA